jgi:hypothetical protein
MHAAGVIEDGSTSTKPDGTPRTFRGRDGAQHPVPNLEAALRDALVAAFGLETPERTLAFLEGLELELGVPIRQVTYTGDPVLLLSRPDGSTESEIDYYQRNVINLSRATSGIGDLNLAARYRLVQRPFALALELRVKAPTGYAGPQGTFGDRPTTTAEFLSDVRRWVTPENVRDDVTLGDGQLDVGLNVLLGYAFPTRTFVRLDDERPYTRVLLVAMDMRQLELGMQAGVEDPVPLVGPRGDGRIPRTPGLLPRVVGAFNGAFKTEHGAYGMAVDGRVLLPPQPGEMLETCADLTRIQAEVGFTPKVPLEEGLRRFVDWFRTYYPPEAG